MARSGALAALADLAGAMLPLTALNLQARIDERLEKIPNQLNEYGYDAYGMSPYWMRRIFLPSVLLYRTATTSESRCLVSSGFPLVGCS
jgi:hypothetical protein